MIDFILKKSSENSPHYNLTFMKLVHKRNGDVNQEPGTTLYTISLNEVKNRISHLETINRFGDKDITLKEYLSEFYKVYIEVCELLKKIL